MKKRTLIIIDSILICVLVVSVIALLRILFQYASDRASYQEAQSLAVSTPAPTLAPLPTQVVSASEAPEPMETPPITVDFSAISEEGRHVRGWLYNAGTVINYPIVYYTNNEYYLTHDYTGMRNKSGALFFDTSVTKELLGDNLIIYGHHMKDRSMFGSLLQYQKQDYYEAHPTMYLLTLDRNYRIDLISGRFMDSDARNYPVWFADEKARKTYIQNAIAQSVFTPRDPSYRTEVQIVSLVTCAYSNYIEDSKFVVIGWLTEID